MTRWIYNQEKYQWEEVEEGNLLFIIGLSLAEIDYLGQDTAKAEFLRRKVSLRQDAMQIQLNLAKFRERQIESNGVGSKTPAPLYHKG